ncbi:hypothetical protein, partial [Ethanoligenens sp.]|uniref:hypothetical protein n=1 Tax=Ethanoligenens sp. TaxID=2099655 RepID=UPI0039E74C76
MTGFIKLSRKMLDWQWYRNTNTKIAFIHLLLKAAWTNGVQDGTEVKRGQCFLSQSKLSAAVNLSPGETRTALEHLQKTGEISIDGNNDGSLITIQKYDTYQAMDAAWYVQLHRKIRDWRWYRNTNTKIVFLHLLLWSSIFVTQLPKLIQSV